LQGGYDVIVISSLQEISLDGFCKSNHDFLIAFHGKFSYRKHGFRDNDVSLPTGHDVIVISPLRGASGDLFMTDSDRATMTS